MINHPVALITGAARRIGACIARTLHREGYNVALHYHRSEQDAKVLRDELNQQRPDSAIIFQADLADVPQVQQLALDTVAHYGHVNLLVNNASSFYPTPLESGDESQWDDLMGSNLKGPWFLCQALAETLRASKGTIINLADIHGDQPLNKHSIYCMAKAGNRMLTKSLARELAPDVRVNGIAPGAILWPEKEAALNTAQQQAIVDKIPLNRCGSPDDIAQAVVFLVREASYITGQIVSVDGGRRLSF